MSSSVDLDRTIVFERLQHILAELYTEITQHLPVTSRTDPSLENFSSSDGQMTGSLRNFSGEAIDWMVYSRLDAAPMKFGAMRLSTWLKPQIQVPHLVFEFGTVPGLFFYMDYIPRVDLWTDLSYMERYYEPMQPTYLNLRNNPNLSLFVSKALYIRQLQSSVQLCFTCPNTEESLSLIQDTARTMTTQWLTWIEQAEPVPADMQMALARRDRQMRRLSAERDPDNAVVAKLLGRDFTDRLVRALWQSDSEPTA